MKNVDADAAGIQLGATLIMDLDLRMQML